MWQGVCGEFEIETASACSHGGETFPGMECYLTIITKILGRGSCFVDQMKFYIIVYSVSMICNQNDMPVLTECVFYLSHIDNYSGH